MTSVINLVRYWVAAEDSRPGRQEYWHMVLAQKSRPSRLFWETSKVAFILGLSANIVLGISHIL